MSSEEPTVLSLAREQEAAHLSRIAWVPAIANATALISCFTLISGVHDPDTALRALIPSIVLFGTGLSIASWAASEDGVAISQRVLLAQAIQRAERANRRYAEQSARLLTEPATVDYYVFMFGEDEARKFLAKLALEKHTALAHLESETDRDLTTALEDADQRNKEWTKTSKKAIRLRGLAIHALSAGVAWIIFGSLLGLRLQPATP